MNHVMLSRYTTNRTRFLFLFILLQAVFLSVAHAQESPVDSTGTGRDTLHSPKEQKQYFERGTVGNSAPLDFNAAPSGGYVAPMRMMSAPATLGATVGGAQDIGYARRLIESGRVPAFVDFSPEGLYSEHDIPTPSGDCDQPLCLSLGYGFAPTADSASNALFVHLGMNSNIRPEEFKRNRLQLAVVVDRSGSMQGESIEAVRKALRSLAEQLTEDDELILIAFNRNPELLLAATPGNRTDAVDSAIERLTAAGGTDIEAGLQRGFESLEALPERSGVSRRLILFTDAMPNAGRTDSASFRTLTARYADRGIGLTVFGVGLNFGQELIYHITQLRGSNYFYLENAEKIATVFDTEFDYLVTPLVYDLDVRIKTPRGLKLTDVYGLPTWEPGSPDAELHVPTVFLSSNRGAIVLRYEPDNDRPFVIDNDELLAVGSLSYTEPDGSPHRTTTELRHSGKALRPGSLFYTHDGMRMAVALTNIYFGLRDACTLVSKGEDEEALEVIRRAQGVASVENLALADEGLNKEIRLLDRLAKNIVGEEKSR